MTEDYLARQFFKKRDQLTRQFFIKAALEESLKKRRRSFIEFATSVKAATKSFYALQSALEKANVTPT